MGTAVDAPRRRALNLLLALTASACSSGDAPEFDVILRGGTLHAAGDEPGFVADVALAGDRIAAMGDLSGYDARDILDVTGLHVAPGFIDVHSHAGSGLDTEDRSHAEPLLAQGITTVVVNPDGGGLVDLALQRAVLL
ncbi:MAG: D-aminoacylase, partial [Gammaproteobacteria bacterium]|nr:D-aminoacylase [Gammaproteobacteria bacterium]